MREFLVETNIISTFPAGKPNERKRAQTSNLRSTQRWIFQKGFVMEKTDDLCQKMTMEYGDTVFIEKFDLTYHYRLTKGNAMYAQMRAIFIIIAIILVSHCTPDDDEDNPIRMKH